MNTRPLFLAAALAVLTLLSPLSRAETQILDQVVAVIDDDVIMASELRNRLETVTQSLQSRGMEMPPEDVLIRETLDRLILDQMLTSFLLSTFKASSLSPSPTHHITMMRSVM